MGNAPNTGRTTMGAEAHARATDADVWRTGTLALGAAVIWWMAWSSLKLRIGRSVLTMLTVATAAAFLAFLSCTPSATALAERQSRSLMLTLALAVSVVGVLNTMLMAVTQRYREIGTIKCLGGRDALVLWSTLVEAALLGAAGGVIGALLGGGLGLALTVAEHGRAAGSVLDVAALPLRLLGVSALSALLTTISAAIPAWVAARMPPIEAMRGEK